MQESRFGKLTVLDFDSRDSTLPGPRLLECYKNYNIYNNNNDNNNIKMPSMLSKKRQGKAFSFPPGKKNIYVYVYMYKGQWDVSLYPIK